jgi:hypothetical protein
MASHSGKSYHYNKAYMITDYSTEAMELDSPSTLAPTCDDFTSTSLQDLRKRAREATKEAAEARWDLRALRTEARTGEDAQERYQAARDKSKHADEARRKANKELRSAKAKRSRSGARSGVNKSYTYTTSRTFSNNGIKKKTKEPKPKPRPLPKPPLRAHIESRTGTGVWVWSVTEGNRELRDDEVQMMQGMQDLKLLLPPPQMLEAEEENKPKRKQRPTKAERKEMALLAAAEDLVAKVHVEVEGQRELIVHGESKREQRKQRVESDRQKRKQRLEERNTRLGMELDLELKALEDERRGEFQERLDRNGEIKDEASRERRRKVITQALTEREDAEVDDVAAKLGLLGMGSKHSQ